MVQAQKLVKFVGAKPILNVNNVAASLDFYINKLGFTKTFSWSEETEFSDENPAPPTFAEVRCGHFSLMLCQQGQGGPGMWIFLDLASTADMTAMYQEYVVKGVKIVQPPTDQSWNTREMLVEDLDGHTLRIAAGIE